MWGLGCRGLVLFSEMLFVFLFLLLECSGLFLKGGGAMAWCLTCLYFAVV